MAAAWWGFDMVSIIAFSLLLRSQPARPWGSPRPRGAESSAQLPEAVRGPAVQAARAAIEADPHLVPRRTAQALDRTEAQASHPLVAARVNLDAIAEAIGAAV